MDDQLDVVVVIPTYNEAENISKVVQAVLGSGLKGLGVLVVDDGSPDGTGDVVRRLSEKNPRIFLHERGEKKGIGSAYYEGFQLALRFRPKVVVSMDGDGSHPAGILPKLVDEIFEGAEAAVASRYVSNGKWAAGFSRMVVSRGANLLARVATGVKIKDLTSGYRAYSSRAVHHLLEKPFEKGYVFQVELLYRLTKAGFNVVEVPFVFTRREKGESKLSTKEVLRFFVWCIKILLKRLFGR